MNERQAVAKLKRLLGPKMAYRYNPRALSSEERAAKRIAARQLSEHRAAVKLALEAKRDELLSDPDYQRLLMEHRKLMNDSERLRSELLCYRVEVGTTGGMFFSVAAQADTWAEAVEAVEKQRAAA